ncbi:MAG: hypothetical protein H7Z43_08320, partial [Clostridia bacterium]|nr:hypothetical protein [Deltaproteobacteria bacterium]
VSRAATFNTSSQSASVKTYIVRESLVYDPRTDVWSSIGANTDVSATAAGARGSTNGTTGLAALGSGGSIVAVRSDASILFDAVDDKTASYTVETLVLPETPDFVSVTASANGSISTAWSTSASLRVYKSRALNAASDTADADWTAEGTSLSEDGSQGVAITYAEAAPVIAYAASSHDPVIHLRYWNDVDWIPFAQLGSDILSGQPGYNPVITADISRVCVAYSEVAASTTKTRVICFGK